MTLALFTYYRIIPAMIIILSLFTMTVGATYTQIGTTDSDYVTGIGIFDENLNPIITGSSNVIAQRYPPLVDDLDGDGINEIVFLDGNSLIILQNSTLDAVTSVTIGNISSYVHMILFDIDGDSNPNILIASNSSFIQSFSFNGSIITKNMQVGLDGSIDSPSFIGDGEVVIQCLDTDKCIAVYPERFFADAGNALYAMGFDSSGNNGSAILLKDTSGGKGSSIFCFPREKHIAVNQRGGGNIFVVSNAHWSQNDGEELNIYGISIQANLTLTEEYENNIGSYDMIGGNPTISGGDCQTLSANPEFPQNSFTSITSTDIINAGDEEILIGFMESDSTYRMASFDSNGNFLSFYPSVQTAEGVIVSNIIRAEIFSNGKNQDFCMMGYDSDGNRLDLLCASEQGGTPTLAKSEEFFFALGGTGLNDLTTTYNNHNSIIHSGFHKGSNPASEIITTYGVFEIDYTTQTFGATPGVNSDILLINQFGVQNSTVIPIDVEGNLNVDMLMLNPFNLFYLNDGFINSPGEIKLVTYNPCVIGTVVKENTTLQIQMELFDFDGDDVRGGVTFYSGDTNEFTFNQTGFVSSGSVISFSGTVNKSINSGILRLFANDIENPNSITEQTQTFTVDANGIVFNSATCTENFTVTTAGSELINGTGTAAVNPIDALADQVVASSGVSKAQFWLMLMFMMAAATMGGFIVKFQGGSPVDFRAVLGIIVAEQSLLLFLGALFGFISISLVVVLVIAGSIVLALWITSMFTRDRG